MCICLTDFSDMKVLNAFAGVMLQWQTHFPLNSKHRFVPGTLSSFCTVQSYSMVRFSLSSGGNPQVCLRVCQVPPQDRWLASGWAATLLEAPQISLSWSPSREKNITPNQFTRQKTFDFVNAFALGSTWDLDVAFPMRSCRTLGRGSAVTEKWSWTSACFCLMLSLPPWISLAD